MAGFPTTSPTAAGQIHHSGTSERFGSAPMRSDVPLCAAHGDKTTRVVAQPCLAGPDGRFPTTEVISARGGPSTLDLPWPQCPQCHQETPPAILHHPDDTTRHHHEPHDQPAPRAAPAARPAPPTGRIRKETGGSAGYPSPRYPAEPPVCHFVRIPTAQWRLAPPAARRGSAPDQQKRRAWQHS